MKHDHDFIRQSYQKHAEHFSEYAACSPKHNHAKNWLEENRVDHWRHQRLWDLIMPLLHHDKNANWITIGDGRYGLDAQYIIKQGGNCLPTDISKPLLEEAFIKKLIPKYSVENAEALSFESRSFDYALCKESYHHFPRPHLALYEMLRVCKKAIVLIEPNDIHASTNIIKIIFKYLFNLLKYLLRKKIQVHNYEEVGNYIYTISLHEITKMAISLNLKAIAYKGINDYCHPNAINEETTLVNHVFLFTKFKILISNILCFLGLKDYQILSMVIFKCTPEDTVRNALVKKGYKFITLPQNPFT